MLVDKRQTRVTLGEIVKAIQKLGGWGAESIVQTQLFIQKHEDVSVVMEEFREVLGQQQGGDIGSTAILLMVPNFSDLEMPVEIMVDAIADCRCAVSFAHSIIRKPSLLYWKLNEVLALMNSYPAIRVGYQSINILFIFANKLWSFA